MQLCLEWFPLAGGQRLEVVRGVVPTSKAEAGVALAGVALVTGPAAAGAAGADPGAGGKEKVGAIGEGASTE
eukprot:2554951-Pleurochrysis_carterae.AAC.2